MVRIGGISINPTKIIYLGFNYQEHIAETKQENLNEPVLFCKTLNCLITDGEPIIYPKLLNENRKNKQVDHEVELAFIMIEKFFHSLILSFTSKNTVEISKILEYID